ncbi:MAG: PspC domain-containing protein [Candidatus Neomarinimicrobiota bacterium]|nr:PspC domain-containing protein [Candidatus Neomarinimicrobiota bacterium]
MKRLDQNKTEGKLAGVSAGLGDYFDIDPVLIQLLFACSILWFGVGILFYITAWILMLEHTICPTATNS